MSEVKAQEAELEKPQLIPSRKPVCISAAASLLPGVRVKHHESTLNLFIVCRDKNNSKFFIITFSTHDKYQHIYYYYYIYIQDMHFTYTFPLRFIYINLCTVFVFTLGVKGH